jgi:hypothetical protein
MKVTEMKNARVAYISLVKRGANRIPFRVLKSDDEEQAMLNIDSLNSALGRVVKTADEPKVVEVEAPAGTVVLGVATMASGTELEKVAKAIEEAGYSVAKADTYEDGSVCFMQVDEADLEADDVSVVRLSENLALVVKGFSPYRDVVSNSFVDAVKAQGFFSSVYNACDAFRDSLRTILDTSDSPADANLGATKLFTDFQAYVTGLVSDLPASSFRMASSVDAIYVAKEEAEEEAEEEEEELDADFDLPADEEVTEENPAEVVEKSDTSEDPAKEETPVAKTDEQTPTTTPDDIAKVLEAISGLTLAVKSVSDGQEALAEEQKSLGLRVDEVTRKSEDALKAVGGTVLGSASGADAPAGDTNTQKSDSDPRSGCFDTAFIPKKR